MNNENVRQGRFVKVWSDKEKKFLWVNSQHITEIIPQEKHCLVLIGLLPGRFEFHGSADELLALLGY